MGPGAFRRVEKESRPEPLRSAAAASAATVPAMGLLAWVNRVGHERPWAPEAQVGGVHEGRGRPKWAWQWHPQLQAVADSGPAAVGMQCPHQGVYHLSVDVSWTGQVRGGTCSEHLQFSGRYRSRLAL